jgi:hypothetical protein
MLAGLRVARPLNSVPLVALDSIGNIRQSDGLDRFPIGGVVP